MKSSSSELERGKPAGMPELMAVAALASPGGGGCTATLISDRVVLTAAHCVAPFGTGCAEPGVLPAQITVNFADADGNPLGANRQLIRVIGFAVHPDAWANRVTACPNPVPPLVGCPDDATVATLGPSCNLLEQCRGDRREFDIRAGLHFEHDIAVAYLEHAPVGIQPLPVIVSQEPTLVFPPPTYTFPGLNAFLDTGPRITLVAYGGGSTDWDPGPGWAGGRDFGTAIVTGRIIGGGRWDRCDGVRTNDGPQPAVNLAVADHRDAYVRNGDSGGPVLVGPGPIVPDAMLAPTDLPDTAGLSAGRYIIGVNSTGGDAPSPGDQFCSPLVFCPAGQSCVDINVNGVGRCATSCTTSADCANNAACRSDNGPPHCRAVGGNATTTFDAGNGAWLAHVVNDIDGDGVPNERDNCPGVSNPGQENCNLDAELDRQGDVLGDACDPVPCPRASDPVVAEVLLERKTTSCGGMERTRQVRSRIAPDVIGSHNLINGTQMSQQGKRTAFRFCQVDPINRNRWCSVRSNQRRDQDFDLPDSSFYNWRDVTLPSLGATGAFAAYDYPSHPAALDWTYWDDRARWIADSWLVDPGTTPKPANALDSLWNVSSGLFGAFGLRAGLARSQDLLGSLSHRNNEVHFTPDLQDGYAMGEGLGRHYLDPMGPDGYSLRIWDSCLECAGSACPRRPPITLRLPNWKGGNPLPTDPVLPPWWKQWPRPWTDGPVEALLVQGESGWGPVDDQGRILQVDGLISPALREALADSTLQLVPVVEPNLEAGAGYHYAQGLMIRSDGTAISSVVKASSEGVTLAWEKQIAPGRTAQAAPVARELPAIAPRTQFAAVFSRTLGALVLVGGRDQSGQLTQQIWMVPQWGDPFLLTTPGYEPNRVLAATVATTDGMLWVLDDRLANGWLHIARLVRIDPLSGHLEVVWQGPRLGVFDQHWLGVDRDGNVLLFGSSKLLRKHVTVRFDATPFVLGTAKPNLMRFDQGELIGQPLVDSHGYQFVMRKGGKRLRVQRLDSLDQDPWKWPDLSGCL